MREGIYKELARSQSGAHVPGGRAVVGGAVARATTFAAAAAAAVAGSRGSQTCKSRLLGGYLETPSPTDAAFLRELNVDLQCLRAPGSVSARDGHVSPVATWTSQPARVPP